MEALFYELHLGLLSLRAKSTKDKRGLLASSQPEICDYIGGFFSQSHGAVQRQRRTITAYRRKNRGPVFEVHSMPRHRIIESWLARHPEIDLASYNGHGADNLIRLCPVARNGHIVSQFGHTLVRQKSREQNVRLRQIQLSCVPLSKLRLNLKRATSLVIEERCKNCGRVKIWIAEKVDGTVYPHQGNRAHTANYPVVLNRFKAHRWVNCERELQR